MSDEVLDILAAIRRTGGDVKVVGPDRLKLIAPASALPELADRVRRAKPLLLVALADRKRATEPSSHSVNRSPADRLACHGEAAWWRHEFVVRIISRELAGARSRPKAEQLAFED